MIMASMCRICLEDDADLLKPCMCKGSMAGVHAKCWERQQFHCTICHFTKPNTTTTEVHNMRNSIVQHRDHFLFKPKVIADDFTQFLYYLLPFVNLFHVPFYSAATFTIALFIPRYFWPIMRRRGWRKHCYLALIIIVARHPSLSLLTSAALKQSLLIDFCTLFSFRIMCTFMMYTTIGLDLLSLTWSQLAKYLVL